MTNLPLDQALDAVIGTMIGDHSQGGFDEEVTEAIQSLQSRVDTLMASGRALRDCRGEILADYETASNSVLSDLGLL